MALDSEPFTGIGQNNVGWIAQPMAKQDWADPKALSGASVRY